MSAPKPVPPPLAKPLTVDTVDDAVVVDGEEGVRVALTPAAAVETGVDMIRAGLDLQSKGPRKL